MQIMIRTGRMTIESRQGLTVYTHRCADRLIEDDADKVSITWRGVLDAVSKGTPGNVPALAAHFGVLTNRVRKAVLRLRENGMLAGDAITKKGLDAIPQQKSATPKPEKTPRRINGMTMREYEMLKFLGSIDGAATLAEIGAKAYDREVRGKTVQHYAEFLVNKYFAKRRMVRGGGRNTEYLRITTAGREALAACKVDS